MPHFFEFYLLGSMALILVVFLAAYFIFLWLDHERPWRKARNASLATEDATYYLKGYDAKPNIRRA